MVVGNWAMSSPPLVDAVTPPPSDPSPPAEGSGRKANCDRGRMILSGQAVANILKVASTRNPASLSLAQRSLITNVLVALRQQQMFLRHQRLLLLHRRHRQLQERERLQRNQPSQSPQEFKEPGAPPPRRRRHVRNVSTVAPASVGKRCRIVEKDQWLPVPWSSPRGGGAPSGRADEWHPVKVDRLAPPTQSCPSHQNSPNPPVTFSRVPPLHCLGPCSNDHNNSAMGTANPCCPLGTQAQKYYWTNQLTRIFLQEVPEDEQGKEADAAEAKTSSISSSSSRASLPQGDGSPGACSSSSSSSSSNLDSSKVSTLSSPSSTSVVTTLASTGMGNPFARHAPQPTWGSESSDQRPILAPSRLTPHSDTGITKVSSSTNVLRPSTLSSVRSTGRATSSILTPPTLTVTGSSPPQTSKSAFKLKPSILSPSANPFSGPSDPENKADSASGSEDGVLASSDEPAPSLAVGTDVSSSTSTSPSKTAAAAASPSEAVGNRGRDQQQESRTNVAEDKPPCFTSPRNVFFPISRNGEEHNNSRSANLGSNSFIFGQNLQSKVTGAESSVTSSSDASATTNGEKPTGNLFSEAASEFRRSPDSAAATNGRMTTGNLFTEAASVISVPNEENAWNSGQSLEESSRELTEKENSQKRKFDQVEVITGEESESNVLQMNCKLYAWVNGSWQERGRGILRLNDWDAEQEIHSRLVIRTQGTLTVMLNTKVWSEMSVERASNKSVRFTALDADGQPKIFLAMGSPKDIDLLYNSLEWRVATSRSQESSGAETAKKSKKDETGSASLTS